MSDYYNRIHDEKVRAAHKLLDEKRADVDRYYTPAEREAIRAALPPLPEPERPRITPAKELAQIGEVPMGGIFGDREATILRARAEIIAWLEWRCGNCEFSEPAHHNGCRLCIERRDILNTLRQADKS